MDFSDGFLCWFTYFVSLCTFSTQVEWGGGGGGGESDTATLDLFELYLLNNAEITLSF